MPVSSFYGMQTSLRGLLAQQRMLDTTGHNIANASTKGYSRQEATLAATQALQLTVAGRANADRRPPRRRRRRRRASAASATSSWTRSSARQNTNVSEWTARADALDSAELSLAEPGENGINQQLAKFWNAWSDLSKSPDGDAAKQALVQRANGLTDSIQSVRSQMVAAQQGAAGRSTARSPARAARSPRSPPSSPTSTTTISKSFIHGDSPNDLMDRRDLLIDQLSGYGQVSVEQLDSGSTNVSFVDRDDGHRPTRSSPTTTRRWAGPPAGDWNPGGEMGGLLSVGKTPGGTIDGYLAQIDSFTKTLADTVNSVYGGNFFSYGSPDGRARSRSTPRSQAAPASIRGGTGATGLQRPRARGLAAARQRRRIDGVYKAFVAKVGGDLDESNRACRPTPRCSPTRSRTAARASPGVSMDEEMSNLVRFQRAYQASARAMSTMDEMLDVLINRTGRVGL